MTNNLRAYVTQRALRKLEDEYTHLSDKVLLAWLNSLDLSKENHACFLQTHNRESCIIKLRKAFPNKNSQLIERLGELLALSNDLQLTDLVWVPSTKAITEHVLTRPRFVEVLLDRVASREGPE